MKSFVKAFIIISMLFLILSNATFADNVTFKVDMNFVNSIGLFDPTTQGTAIRGKFTGWNKTPENLPDWILTDNNSDLVYEGTFDVGIESPINYKFVVYQLGTTDITFESGDNRQQQLTGEDLILDPVLWEIEVTFQVDMSPAIRLGVFDPDSNGVSVRGNFTKWNKAPSTLPDWALADDNGDNIYDGTFINLNRADFDYKFVITDRDTNLISWEPSIENRLDTLKTVEDVKFEVAFWDSIPAPGEAFTANVLFKLDISPLLEMGFFDPALDTMKLQGSFGGWKKAPPEHSIMHQSLISPTQYEIAVPIEGTPGQEHEYKYRIFYDTQDTTRKETGWIGWEEPASTGGGNRVLVFGDQEQQEVPIAVFNDIFLEDMIPEGVTVNVKATADMRCALRDHQLALPPNGLLQMDIKLWIWLFLTDTADANNDTTVMAYEDADGDSIYTLNFVVTGPLPNFLQYKLQWSGLDELAGSFGFGNNRVRYIRKNPDGTWPSQFEMGLDYWNAIQKPLTVEERNGEPIDDESPCDLTPVSVERTGSTLPNKYHLSQNYPNPFNPSTTIEYSIQNSGHVSIDIYNLLGEKVRSLVDELQSAGKYKLVWDITKSSSGPLPTGIYFYRMKSGEFQETKRLLLLK